MSKLARYEIGPLAADSSCVWAEAAGGHFKTSNPCSTPHATRATMSYQLHRHGGRSLATVRAMCEVHARDWAQRNGAEMPVDMSPLAIALAEVARLREALEKISAILPCSEPCKPRVMCGTCHRGDDTDGEIDCTGCIARAALGRT